MLKARYVIVGVFANGMEVELFRWNKKPEAGIELARAQETEFGLFELPFTAIIAKELV